MQREKLEKDQVDIPHPVNFINQHNCLERIVRNHSMSVSWDSLVPVSSFFVQSQNVPDRGAGHDQEAGLDLPTNDQIWPDYISVTMSLKIMIEKLIKNTTSGNKPLKMIIL